MRRPILTLAVLSLVTFFLGLGRQAISDSDEAFYAEAAREMVQSGEWLTPHFNYEDRWQKPVLYYWLTAATYRALGTSEAAARLWSALAGLGLVLLTWRIAGGLAGFQGAAWLAGAIVATCYGYFAMARLALPDLPLAFCITLTIWSALKRRWLLAGAAAGLGFLLKGPVALAVPGLVLAPIWWAPRPAAMRSTVAADPPRPRDLALGGLVAAAIGLPWYVAMTLEHGSAYLESFFIGDNLERFATDRFNEPRPIWFYAPILIGGLLPWSPYLLALPWRPAADMLRRRRTFTEAEWQLLLWVAVPLVFFTISIGKQPRYILPVLPPVAILLARAIAHRIVERRDAGALATATWATAVLYALAAVLLYRARDLFVSAHAAATFGAVVLLAGAAAAMAGVAATRRFSRIPAIGPVCAAVLLLAVQFGALAGVRPEPVEEIASLIRAHRMASEPVGTYQVFVRNLVFYTGVEQVDLFDEGRALTFLKSPERVLLVVREDDLPRLASLSAIDMRQLGEVRYLNAANVRLRTILAPIPADDLETVLLISNR